MTPPLLSRRDFGSWSVGGLAATALLHLLGREASAAPQPHFEAKAKRVVHISLIGGLSHLDSFDYKPKLAKLHGKKLDTTETPDIFFGQVGLLRQPDWKFRPRGQSGLMISDLFPHVAEMADELTVIRSMTADSANHTPALYLGNSGFQFSGFPSMGSWASFGLGSESEELPAYVVLPDPRGQPNGGAAVWSNGFLPAEHQGVVLQSGESPVRDLFPKEKQPAEAESRELLKAMNAAHREHSGADDLLAARTRSYELAARMQLSVPAVADVSKETKDTHTLYGLDDPKTAAFGRNCLLARRLLEKGVRFVQLFSGGPVAGSPRVSWDAHENVKENHTLEAERIDRPVGALLRDLKQRGMLKDTLVLFTTEFGRTPFAQSGPTIVGPGRDHNKYGFSVWMAGAGLKAGSVYGATDDIGWKVAERPVPWHDFHATVLHLLGLNHEKLTFYHNGIQRRLTNVHGEVVKGVLG
ncbi:DUF1501 domain-containing protein [Limnoglobus roseus]|uniref:DUF1501 domain-containing protein n=1 Tax=Limnoglobus roseus TaxID=2598579 RepID=A0A5C1AE80_9BACT|nr:DUF1501 domain-containing protein [Limnoglobus roseus]QEL15388.1 hypothetical protein PX52LOC_02303 [Limnoglobus roseus]